MTTYLYAVIEYQDRYGIMPYYLGVFSTKEKALVFWQEVVAKRPAVLEPTSEIQIEEIPLDEPKHRWNTSVVKVEE